MIRKATSKDLEACADLTYLSMPGILRYLIGTDEASVKRVLGVLFQAAHPNLFSRHHQWVVERDDRIVGAMAVGPGWEHRALTRGMFAAIPALVREMGAASASKSLLRSLLLLNDSIEYQPDEMIGYRCSVYPDHRGTGVYREIDEALCEMARGFGLHTLAFGVEADNIREQHILEALGSRRVSTCDRSRFRRHGLPDVYKYIRTI